MLSATRASSFKCSPLNPNFGNKTPMDPLPRTLHRTFSRPSSLSPPREGNSAEATISLQEWQGWGTTSPLPATVAEVVGDLKGLEGDMDTQMSFGDIGGKLRGDFKIEEDKKHRATYQALENSEKKLQFFSARQIACRLLGSRGYLCQKCWLPLEDCMCSKITPCSLWPGLRIWVYMHPKDFLRQNNTGKLLWQLFGVQAATLCLFGIAEHEEIMWNAFRFSGKNKVWCLFPNKNAPTKSIKEIFMPDYSSLECSPKMLPVEDRIVFVPRSGWKLKLKTAWIKSGALHAWALVPMQLFPFDNSIGGNFHIDSAAQTKEVETLNFVLIDGTWNNSAAMVRRLKDQARLVWGEEDLSCISLATGASAMHRLRPQPSWDRTCTAAAAIGLLYELQLLPDFSSFGLDKQAESVEAALAVLLEALTVRRLRMGRSITRRERHNSDIC